MLKKKMEGEGESNKQGTKRSEEGERLAEDGEEDVEVHCKDRQVTEPEEKTNDGGDQDDIYIMMSVCLCVTKNHHFLLGVSCNHLNPP